MAKASKKRIGKDEDESSEEETDRRTNIQDPSLRLVDGK